MAEDVESKLQEEAESPRFIIRDKHWYAVEILGDEFGISARSHSPIMVHSIEPLGYREFDLFFYHANYPEGVRDKRYRLRTIYRGEFYVLARSTEHNPVRHLLIFDISHTWLNANFQVSIPNEANLVEWLERNA
jgi:hypothetical protein